MLIIIVSAGTYEWHLDSVLLLSSHLCRRVGAVVNIIMRAQDRQSWVSVNTRAVIDPCNS